MLWYHGRMETDNLNPKQAAFVREYLTDFNASAAAIRAGYARRGAHVHAHRLLSNAKIQTAIKRHTDAATNERIMEYAEACEILTAMARGNVGHYMGAGGEIDHEAILNHYPQAVQAVDVSTALDEQGNATRITKLRLCDRVRALERLAKLRGWDQPARVQTEDVTPPRYDLSKLSDDELTAFEATLAKVQA